MTMKCESQPRIFSNDQPSNVSNWPKPMTFLLLAIVCEILLTNPEASNGPESNPMTILCDIIDDW